MKRIIIFFLPLLLITFCAAVLGTLLGGLVCWARMSRHAWLQQAMTTHGHETLKERQYRHPDQKDLADLRAFIEKTI